MSRTTIDYALSIGTNCRAKFHLKRIFEHSSPAGVFDWQVTPADSVLEYLASQFTGMFELSDLYVDERSGVVFNRRYRTSHQHEFPRHCTRQELAQRYSEARGRHDHLCNKMLSTLGSGRRILMVISRPQGSSIDPLLVQHIESAARRLVPDERHLRFALEPDGAHLGTDWTGNHERWNQLLSPYAMDPIRMAGRRLRSVLGSRSRPS